MESIPLAGDDAEFLMKGRTPYIFILYDDLAKYNSLDDLFGDDMAILILLQIKDGQSDIGHWICCFKNPTENNQLYWFDPLGMGVEEEMSITHEDRQLMTKLLKNKKVVINSIKFQESKKDLNTCFRHVCCRVVFNHLNNEQYYSFITKSHYNPDEMVTLLTLLSMPRGMTGNEILKRAGHKH